MDEDARAVPVTVGLRSDNGVEIVEGVAAGDLVVVPTTAADAGAANGARARGFGQGAGTGRTAGIGANER
jgi:hypothetical protein